jgi:hypothetical protein
VKYQVGDEIIVLLSNEEGRIIEILNDKMVMIDVRGVKFPAYMDQIDFPYFKRFTEKKLFPQKVAPQKIYVDQIPKEKVIKNDSKDEEGVWLNIIPKFILDDFNDEVVDSLKIYLSNRNRISYQFIYDQSFAGISNFSIESTIAPFTDFYIHDIAFEAINDSPSFSVDFSLTAPHKKKADHFEAIVKIKPKQLFQKIEILKEDDKATISYPLFETYPDKIEDNHIPIDVLRNAGYKVYDASKIKQNIQQPRSVIDLHIEKIMDGHSHLSNAEILHFQIQEFEKWFELAFLNHLPSMIIIHGIGKGKLKQEIHDLLKVKPGVKSFINQYSDFYGYGATEVFFQY